MTKPSIQWLPYALSLALIACGNRDSSLKLELGKVSQVRGCSVRLFSHYADLIDVQHSCDAALTADSPLWDKLGAYSMRRGDCVALRGEIYCLTSLDPTVVLTPTFRAAPEWDGVIWKIGNE